MDKEDEDIKDLEKRIPKQKKSTEFLQTLHKKEFHQLQKKCLQEKPLEKEKDEEQQEAFQRAEQELELELLQEENNILDLKVNICTMKQTVHKMGLQLALKLTTFNVNKLILANKTIQRHILEKEGFDRQTCKEIREVYRKAQSVTVKTILARNVAFWSKAQALARQKLNSGSISVVQYNYIEQMHMIWQLWKLWYERYLDSELATEEFDSPFSVPLQDEGGQEFDTLSVPTLPYLSPFHMHPFKPICSVRALPKMRNPRNVLKQAKQAASMVKQSRRVLPRTPTQASAVHHKSHSPLALSAKARAELSAHSNMLGDPTLQSLFPTSITSILARSLVSPSLPQVPSSDLFTTLEGFVSTSMTASILDAREMQVGRKVPHDPQGGVPSGTGRSGEAPSKGEQSQQGGSGGAVSGHGSSGVGGGSGGSGGDRDPPPPWKYTETSHEDDPKPKKKKQEEEEGEEKEEAVHAGGYDDDKPKTKPRKEEEKHDGGERDGEDAGRQAVVGEGEEGGIGQMARVDGGLHLQQQASEGGKKDEAEHAGRHDDDEPKPKPLKEEDSGLHLQRQASANHSCFAEEVNPQNTSTYVYIIPNMFQYNLEPAEGHYVEYYANVLFSLIEQMRPLLPAFPGLTSHPNSPNQSPPQSSSSPSPPLPPALLPQLSPWQSPHDSAVSSQSHSNTSASFSSSLSHNSLGIEETHQPESDTDQGVLPPLPCAHPGQQPNTTVQPSPPSPEPSQENDPIPFQSLAEQTNSENVHSSESLHECKELSQ